MTVLFAVIISVMRFSLSNLLLLRMILAPIFFFIRVMSPPPLSGGSRSLRKQLYPGQLYGMLGVRKVSDRQIMFGSCSVIRRLSSSFLARKPFIFHCRMMLFDFLEVLLILLCFFFWQLT